LAVKRWPGMTAIALCFQAELGVAMMAPPCLTLLDIIA
jgi:hypothetical protein